MIDPGDLNNFLRMFEVNLDQKIKYRRRYTSYGIVNHNYGEISEPTFEQEEEMTLSIPVSQLKRLLDILTQKGYYHDDIYLIRLREEEEILCNPELKNLHDQYKTYLYMLCGDEWREF